MIRTAMVVATTVLMVFASASEAVAEENSSASDSNLREEIRHARSQRTAGTALVATGGAIAGLSMIPTIMGLATWDATTGILVGAGVTALVLSVPLIVAGVVLRVVGRRRLNRIHGFSSYPIPSVAASPATSSYALSLQWHF